MFQAVYRSSSGAPNCICSLWFLNTCGDRPLSRLSGRIPLIIRSSKLYLQPLVYTHMLWPAVVQSGWGIPLIIRSSKLYLQPLVYTHMLWPAVVQAEWGHTAHHQELQTIFAASGFLTHVVTGRCLGWVGAYRSLLGAPNYICSLWFIHTCCDRPLSRLSGGIPFIIRSSKLYLQPLVSKHMWLPAVV